MNGEEEVERGEEKEGAEGENAEEKEKDRVNGE